MIDKIQKLHNWSQFRQCTCPMVAVVQTGAGDDNMIRFSGEACFAGAGCGF